RCYWLEGTKWMNQAFTKPAQPSKIEIFFRARVLYKDVLLAEHLDDIPRMRESAEQSLRLAQQGSDKREIAIARLCLEWALRRKNEDDRGLTLMQQSLIDFQEMNDLFWKAKSY